MILFFDRSIGRKIPEALKTLKPPDLQVEYHDQWFEMDEDDDIWLPKVAAFDWIVIGQDHHYHLNSPELEAVKQYGIGVFYLWGAEESKWETLRCFARGYDNILHALDRTPKPFIYKVERHGGLNEIYV